jgi:predicted small secreted protein
MKRTVNLLLLSLFTLSLAACNTIAGVGEDVEAVGEEIEETAEGN